MERRVARLEFAEGALARLRVPVPAEGAESGRDVLTDMDVLSIDVDLRLRLSRSSLECKSGKGQAGEPMTLVWLAGFRQLLRLDKVVFVRPAVSSRGRALARRLGIGVLDEQTVRAREDAHRWLPEKFAHLDGGPCAAAESHTDTQLKGLPDVPASLAQFLRSEALLARSPALLAAVESLGAAAVRQGMLPDPAATVLGSHALVAVLLAALQDAGRLDELSQRALRDWLERALTIGDPEDQHLLPLLERADALVRHVVERTHRAYVDAGADAIRIDMPSLRAAVAAPPGYLDDYLDFVTRLRANPLVARDLLQTAELACFEALLGGDAWKAPAFAHLFTTEHLGLLSVALRCLARIAGPQVANALGGLSSLRFPGDDGRVPDRRATRTGAAARGTAPASHRQIDGHPPTVRAEGPPDTEHPRSAANAGQSRQVTSGTPDADAGSGDQTGPGSGHAVKLPFDDAGDAALGVVWGKADAQGSMHLLLGHLFDTAAVGELMWDRFLPAAVRNRVDNHSGGRGRSLFALLCGLHDVGKATPAFQMSRGELATQVRAASLERRGHTQAIQPPHGQAGADIVRGYLSKVGWEPSARSWLWPLIAGHHGFVPAAGRLRSGGPAAHGTGPWPEAQRAFVDKVASELGGDLRSFSDLAAPSRGSQLALSGLIIMADWIASDERHFAGQPELAAVSLGASRERARRAWERLGLRGGWRSDRPAPRDQPDLLRHRFDVAGRPAQTGMVQLAKEMPAPGLLILEAPMGEGKTEAALAAAEVLARRFGADGVFVGLPTQATADTMFNRVRGWLTSIDPDVPIGLLQGRARFNREWAALRTQVRFAGIGDLDEYEPGDDAGVTRRRAEGPPEDGGGAAAEWLLGPKRGLLTPVTIGTVDQLAHAATRTRHVMLRHAGLAGRVVVLDEVHAYDVCKGQFLLEALRWLADAGVPVILLSATLPSPLRTRLVRAYLQGTTQERDVDIVDLPEPTGYPNATTVCRTDGGPPVAVESWPSWRPSLRVGVEVLEETEDFHPATLAAAVTAGVEAGGCALVVCNTVTRAQDVYRELRSRFGEDVVLLHDRLVDAERAARAERVAYLLGRPGPAGSLSRPRRLVVVATQVAEQSFDIDVDLLVTDLAPIDLLLQRVGRLHRHDLPAEARPAWLRSPKMIVSGLRLPPGSAPLWPGGSRAAYGNHLLLRSAALVADAGAGDGWSVPADVPRLVAAGYGQEPLGPVEWADAASTAAREWSAKERRRETDTAGLLLAGENGLGQHTLEGLHEQSTAPLDDEEKVAAVIRDGEESIEVVLVRRSPSGYLTLGGRNMGPDGEAASDDAVLEEVVGASVRLPASKEITAAARAELAPLPGWKRYDPWLRRARALILDENMSAALGAYRLMYDAEIGLRLRRAADR